MQKEGTSSSGDIRFGHLFLDNRLCLAEEKIHNKVEMNRRKQIFFGFALQTFSWHTKHLATIC